MNREHIKNMRWLYDSDESYKKAVRAMLAEEVSEHRRALLKKRLRKAKFQRAMGKVKSPPSVTGRKLLPQAHISYLRLVRWLRRSPRSFRRRLKDTRFKVALGAAGLLALVVMIFGAGLAARHKAPAANGPGRPGGASGAVAGDSTDAPFQPLIISGEGTPTDTKYDDAKKVLTYKLKIDGADAIVSQQEYPEEFKKDRVKFDNFVDSIPNHEVVPLPVGTAYLSVQADTQKAPYGVYLTTDYLIFVKLDHAIEKTKFIDFFKDAALE